MKGPAKLVGPARSKEDILGHWTFLTPKVIFVIAECTSKGVYVFCDNYIGHYKSSVEAAEAVASGNDPALLCAPEDGKSLGIPPAVHPKASIGRKRKNQTTAVC
jgi:hypothetical protein